MLPGVSAPRLPHLGPAPAFAGTGEWFNTAGDRPLSHRRPARPRRADRLLDLHVHQLHPHAALPRGLGRALPRRGARDRRRRVARVPLRARRRQRRRGHPPVRHPLPGRPGQRPGHLERVGQRVLAGRLPDRRARRCALRRPSARATTRRPRRHPRCCWPRPAPRDLGSGVRARDVIVPSAETTPETYLGVARAAGWVDHEPLAAAPMPTRGRTPPSRSTTSPTAARGRSAPSRRSPGAGATIEAGIQARHVYLVLSPPAHGAGRVARLRRRPPDHHDRRRLAAPLHGRIVRHRLPAQIHPALLARHQRLLVHLRVGAQRAPSGGRGHHRRADRAAGPSSLADVGRHRVDEVAERAQPHATPTTAAVAPADVDRSLESR